MEDGGWRMEDGGWRETNFKNGYRYPQKYGITIATIKTNYNCTVYASLVQDLAGRKKILCQVEDILSKISGIKILLLRLHGGYCRKRLISPEKVWKNFFLIRVRLEYKRGNETRKITRVIYPSDVYRYGRQTLDVLEEVAEFRCKKKKSWTFLANEFYERYEFSLNRIKRMIKRVSLAFERLMTSQTIRPDDQQTFLNVDTWICVKVEGVEGVEGAESFERLSFSYRDKMLYGPIYLRHKGFYKDLFSPP
jgi:hypothetical protein